MKTPFAYLTVGIVSLLALALAAGAAEKETVSLDDTFDRDIALPDPDFRIASLHIVFIGVEGQFAPGDWLVDRVRLTKIPAK